MRGQDVWALGILLFVLVTGVYPWHEPSLHDRCFHAFRAGNVSFGPWAAFPPELVHVRAWLT